MDGGLRAECCAAAGVACMVCVGTAVEEIVFKPVSGKEVARGGHAWRSRGGWWRRCGGLGPAGAGRAGLEVGGGRGVANVEQYMHREARQ